MNIKKIIDNLMVAGGVLVLIAAISFVGYGVETQCPDTAIYIYCGKDGK